MQPAWLTGLVGALVLLSILRDLLRGRSRLRGQDETDRATDPGAYWSTVAVKTLLLAVLLGLHLAGAR